MTSLAKDVRQFCSTCGLRLNRDLGQHFLIDPEVLEEIGPGIGVLTRELLDRVASVTAVEIDPRFPPLLQAFVGFERMKKLTVVKGNALEVSFPETPYKIVANIPYHITSPLLRHAFLESTCPPKSLTLLIQREVAEKICDEEQRGILTIVVGLFGTPRLIRTVPPEAFLPPPAVKSAILHVTALPAPRADAETIERVLRLVKIGFGQKRKMLRNTFASLPGGTEMLASAGIDPTRRPETLSIDEWITLAHAEKSKK
jgi:16S rRNA (adenine1518-N6/adenine1519-N6)-dimethyltransferase